MDRHHDKLINASIQDLKTWAQDRGMLVSMPSLSYLVQNDIASLGRVYKSIAENAECFSNDFLKDVYCVSAGRKHSFLERFEIFKKINIKNLSFQDRENLFRAGFRDLSENLKDWGQSSLFPDFASRVLPKIKPHLLPHVMQKVLEEMKMSLWPFLFKNLKGELRAAASTAAFNLLILGKVDTAASHVDLVKTLSLLPAPSKKEACRWTINPFLLPRLSEASRIIKSAWSKNSWLLPTIEEYNKFATSLINILPNSDEKILFHELMEMEIADEKNQKYKVVAEMVQKMCLSQIGAPYKRQNIKSIFDIIVVGSSCPDFLSALSKEQNFLKKETNISFPMSRHKALPLPSSEHMAVKSLAILKDIWPLLPKKMSTVWQFMVFYGPPCPPKGLKKPNEVSAIKFFKKVEKEWEACRLKHNLLLELSIDKPLHLPAKKKKM